MDYSAKRAGPYDVLMVLMQEYEPVCSKPTGRLLQMGMAYCRIQPFKRNVVTWLDCHCHGGDPLTVINGGPCTTEFDCQR